MKQHFKTVMAAFVALTLFAACQKDNPEVTPPTGDTDTEAAAVIGQFVDHTVAPTYMALATKAGELASQLQSMRTTRTQEGVDAACALFLEARAEWEKSEAFLFGAAGAFYIDPHIDSWPLDLDAFNSLMNSQEALQRLDAENGDEVAYGDLGANRTGFHGIEYILFRNGQNRPAADITDNEIIYAIAVAGDLRNCCYQLEVSWIGDMAPANHIEKVEALDLPTTVGGGSYHFGENMKNAGKAGSTYRTSLLALSEMVVGCIDIASEVGQQKIGTAYNNANSDYIESPYSKRSREDFYDNIVSIDNVYMGGVEGSRNEGKSLHAFVKSRNEGLDSRVCAAIATAKEEIAKMPVFVDNPHDQQNQVAMEACAALEEVLGEVDDLLGTL